MRKFTFTFFLLISILPGTFAKGNKKFMHVDYYVWERIESKGLDKDAIKNIAIIYYFKLDPDKEGRLKADKGFIAHLKKLKKVKDKKTEIWLGLGSLDNVAKDSKKLKIFIKDLRKVCQKYRFTGLDIDWEGGHINNNDYLKVIKSLSKAFRPKTRIAVSVGTYGHYITKAGMVKNDVDFVNIQCYYSTTNSWSTQQMGRTLENFHKRSGVPKSKIFVGLPLYGAYDARKHGNEGGIGYNTMIAKGADPLKNHWKEPDTGKVNNYSGVPLTKEKTRYAKENGYAGVFTWEISLDVPYKSEASILRAVDGVLLERTVDHWKKGGIKPEPGTSVLKIDVSKQISRKGVYQISFQYNKGEHGLVIHKASLYCNGKIVAEDKHKGFTGGTSKDNNYKLDVKSFKKGRYILKATVSGSGGNDSNGTITLVPF